MTPRLRALFFVILLLPLDLLVVFVFILVVAMERRRGRRGIRRTGVSDHPGASRHPSFVRRGVAAHSDSAATVVIVNWDGKHLLEESLPALLDAIRFDGGPHEVLVVDNGSTDGSVDFIRRYFPEVRVLPLGRNYGFGGGNNRGVDDVRTDTVILLNNDMIVDRGFLRPLLAGFSDPSVFAVASQIFFSDPNRRREETGKTRARFEGGFFHLWHDEIRPAEESQAGIPVVWAGGGACALDRNKYLEIGGFDPLYHPFYVEDTDLSYQAWKRGWTCVLAPASHVQHKHRGTSRPKFGDRFVENTIRKNQYLFVWKNITDISMIFEHLFNLPRIHGRAILQGGAAGEVRAYLRALRQLPESLRKRLANISNYVISDREALGRSQRP